MKKLTDSLSFIGKTVQVKMGWVLGSRHSKWGFEYKVNYGFVPQTIALDGMELDAYVLRINKPVNEFTGKCIAVIRRQGDEDKLIVVPEGSSFSDDEIRSQTNFQEKFFKIKIFR